MSLSAVCLTTLTAWVEPGDVRCEVTDPDQCPRPDVIIEALESVPAIASAQRFEMDLDTAESDGGFALAPVGCCVGVAASPSVPVCRAADAVIL